MNPLFSRLTSRGRPARRAGLALLAALALLALAVLPVAAATAPAPAAAAPAVSAQVQVESFTLDNGLTFLLIRKPELTTVAAGWVAHVGSANERPGITGLTHLFEHMMFKGSRTIGTTNIERDLAIIAEQEQLQERKRALAEAALGTGGGVPEAGGLTRDELLDLLGG
jgi:predicted Zn-dependent peptidase